MWYSDDRCCSVEWADLPIVDISKAATPEGRAALAPQVRDAMEFDALVEAKRAEERMAALMKGEGVRGGVEVAKLENGMEMLMWDAPGVNREF